MLADRPHACKKKIEEICIPIVEILNKNGKRLHRKYTTQELNVNFQLDIPVSSFFHCHHVGVGELY